MANHCIEVGCPKCGHCHCLRCSSNFQMKPEEIKDNTVWEGEVCQKCDSKVMVHVW